MSSVNIGQHDHSGPMQFIRWQLYRVHNSLVQAIEVITNKTAIAGHRQYNEVKEVHLENQIP